MSFRLRRLAHIASKYEPEPLQIRLLYPETPRRPGVPAVASANSQPTAKVTPRGGQAIEGVVTYLDDFTVSLLDNNGEQHSWSRD